MSVLWRLPNSRFSEVSRAWEEGACVLLGGGPSLTPQQVAQVREAHGVRCIAINNSYLLAPWADICYFADSTWWLTHRAKQDFINFAGEKCSIQDSMLKIDDDAVHILKNRDYPSHGSGLSLDPQMIVTGKNSAYQALNLAVLAGAKTIILLGVDGRPAKDGRSHWHEGHPRPTPLAAYEEYRRAFSAAENEITAAGVRVINASPGSVIDSFEKMDIAEALNVVA